MDLFRRVINKVGSVAADGGAMLASATSSLGSGSRNGKPITSDFPYELGVSMASADQFGGVWSMHYGRSLQSRAPSVCRILRVFSF